jgi:DNA-binding transcriptional ArsR family regulator
VKYAIHTLNKAFDHRVRLGVMAVLLANDLVSFNDLKESLDLTDGNLASHVAALEKAGYVVVNKQFVGKKPNTTTPPAPKASRRFRSTWRPSKSCCALSESCWPGAARPPLT